MVACSMVVEYVVISHFFMANCPIVHVNSFNETRQSQATTPDDSSFFLKGKNELPQAGFKPAMFCMLGRRSTN